MRSDLLSLQEPLAVLRRGEAGSALSKFMRFQASGDRPDRLAKVISILTDPTYRNYRSPAGRSSLEMATMHLCERYAEVHPSRIFYEDQDLKIYQFSRD